MHDGNQVLRFENKFKASDLGGLGIELTERKGTGNYDKERTKFNFSFVPLEKSTLKEQVYSNINKNKIYYNDGKNVNLLNGAVVTSGKEFFQTLGMNFKPSGRKIEYGKNKGEDILIPDIKDEKDIPEKVKTFFKDSYDFLEDLVGKENIVYAEVHYDEDTPHMHFYFIPVVNEVKRKVFETDSKGNLAKHEVTGKDGIKKLLPIQKKDANGKNMFTTEKGKFVNCDQFWKEKGGKASYAKIQDDYNKYINDKGYNLFRGNIGDNVHHKTKAQKEIEDMNNQIEEMKLEFEKNKKLNQIELDTINQIKDLDDNEVLNPQKNKISLYKGKDVDNLIDYSKQIKKQNILNTKDIKEKDYTIETMSKKIEKLSLENTKLKDGRGIKERDELIEKQKQIIKEKSSIIESLENQVEKLMKHLKEFKEKMYCLCDKFCRALGHKIGIHYNKNDDIDYDEMEIYANKINRNYAYKDKSDDFEIGR